MNYIRVNISTTNVKQKIGVRPHFT